RHARARRPALRGLADERLPPRAAAVRAGGAARIARRGAARRRRLARRPLQRRGGVGAVLPAAAGVRVRPRLTRGGARGGRAAAGADAPAALGNRTPHAAERRRAPLAAHHDPAARAIPREELPADLLATLDGSPKKKLPGWIDAPALPPVVLGDAGRLDDEQV